MKTPESRSEYFRGEFRRIVIEALLEKVDVDWIDLIVRDRGWLPLEVDQIVTVTESGKSYEIKRVS